VGITVNHRSNAAYGYRNTKIADELANRLDGIGKSVFFRLAATIVLTGEHLGELSKVF
jgi:hypothetical protein